MPDRLILEKAEPSTEHARQVLEWRNEPEALTMFYHREPKIWEKFWQEYREEYFVVQKLPPVFVSRDGKKVAFLRFREVPHPLEAGSRCLDISINVDKDARGLNLGSRALELAQVYAEEHGVHLLLAEVREGNSASNAAFQKAGFQFLDQTIKRIEDTGEDVRIVRFLWKSGMEKPVRRGRPVFLIDFDGTLADSLSVMKSVYFSFLKKWKQEGSEAEFEEFNGPPRHEMIHALKERYRLEPSEKALTEIYDEEVNRQMQNVRPMRGVKDFLKLALANSALAIVVTSASEVAVKAWLVKFELEPYIAKIVGRESVKWAKPHPEPYLRAILDLHIYLSEAVAIEDSMSGMKAALRAGLKTYVLKGGSAHREATSSFVRKVEGWAEIQREYFS